MPKVLVVDDSLSVRKVVEKALTGRGAEVLSAARAGAGRPGPRASVAPPRGPGRAPPPPPAPRPPAPPPPPPPVAQQPPRAAASRAAAEPIAALEVSEEFSGDDLKSRLESLCTTPGVRLAALADREGVLIESGGDHALDAEVAAALSACVAESSHGIGRDLAQGGLLGMIHEYQHGMLLLHAVGRSALLAVVVADASALGKARYVVRKALPDLERAL